jgi:hypothetical protein
VFFLAALGISLLGIVPNLAVNDYSSERDVINLLSAGGIWGLFVLILGIVGATGEHRHGTITPTLLVTPVRELAVASKAIAYALAGAAITVVIDAVAAAVALPWLAAKGAPLPDAGDLGLVLLGGVIFGALAGALGVGVGALLRNQVAAVVIALVEMMMIEPIVGGLRPDVGRYLPQAGATVLLSGGKGGAAEFSGLTLGTAALLYLGYAALFVVAGMLLERHRDIA